MRNNRIWKKII